MYSMRWQRLVVLVGFFCVVIGWIAETALFQWGVRAGSESQYRSSLVLGIGSVLGYAVIAAASWTWFKWMETTAAPLSGLAHVLRLFGVGNLLLAAGLSALSYFWTHMAISQPYDGRTTPIAAASYGFQFFGFFLAAIAFWGASSEVRSVRPNLPLPEEAPAIA